MLEDKFAPYLEEPIFIEVLKIVRQNSKGKIWLMGGYLYKNIAAALYGGRKYTADIDFIVEERSSELNEIPGWKIEVNNYGVKNYVNDLVKTSMTDLKNAIRISGMKNPSAAVFIEETPLNVQSIAYSLDQNKIIGSKGVEALMSKIVKVNNLPQAEYYAQRKGKTLENIIIEKATELGFGYELPVS